MNTYFQRLAILRMRRRKGQVFNVLDGNSYTSSLMDRRRKRQPTVKIIPVLEKPIATEKRRVGKPPTSTDYNLAEEEGKFAAIYNLTQLMKLQLHIVTELAVFYRFSNKLANPYDR